MCSAYLELKETGAIFPVRRVEGIYGVGLELYQALASHPLHWLLGGQLANAQQLLIIVGDVALAFTYDKKSF